MIFERIGPRRILAVLDKNLRIRLDENATVSVSQGLGHARGCVEMLLMGLSLLLFKLLKAIVIFTHFLLLHHIREHRADLFLQEDHPFTLLLRDGQLFDFSGWVFTVSALLVVVIGRTNDFEVLFVVAFHHDLLGVLVLPQVALLN